MEHAKSLWAKTKDLLAKSNKIGSTEFNDTIQPIEEVYKVANNYIYLVVQHDLAKFKVDKFYLSFMNEYLKTLTTEKMEFQTITQNEVEKEKKENKQKSLISIDENEIKGIARTLRPEYTFTNYVAGPSNRFAYITALNVAEAPHVSTMNPLYIFGDVGLGKTHLMMAVGWYILSNNINANVIYTSAQHFADEYFAATRKNSGYTIEQFYKYYRSADVLLVDDIQFLANKTATQEEFFKLFDYLYENNKQIIITSDRRADELENIMKRLTSRFSWGISVDIKKPDFDLRYQIIKKKLQFALSDPSVVSEEALSFIANNFDSNVRELEGALRRFINYCVAFGISYNEENAKTALNDIIPKDKTNITPDKISSINEVKRAVANYYGIHMEDLASTTRKKEIVIPRQVAIHIIRTKYDIPLKKIGEHFGNRDHATIMHSLDKIVEMMNQDPDLAQDVENIVKKLK
ncbi:MAG: chromosomal replication initiator protein DnaA [Bacilli bacterium]|nr:chromosomal replication initiator protein DnaA [Bacilli bacterium]